MSDAGDIFCWLYTAIYKGKKILNGDQNKFGNFKSENSTFL